MMDMLLVDITLATMTNMQGPSRNSVYSNVPSKVGAAGSNIQQMEVLVPHGKQDSINSALQEILTTEKVAA